MLQLRLMEERRELVRRDDVDALIDQLAGITLTHLSGMADRCSRDMQVRRNIDECRRFAARLRQPACQGERVERANGRSAGLTPSGRRYGVISQLPPCRTG
jgi:hypothetical protein